MEKKLSSISENMRRNFTANVSHELKTPITSISGYAEMMMTGLARSEDLPLLAEKIYTEAQRLIAQDVHDGRVGRGLDGEILLEARVPREGLSHQARVLADAPLVVEVERRRKLLAQLPELLRRHEG